MPNINSLATYIRLLLFFLLVISLANNRNVFSQPIPTVTLSPSTINILPDSTLSIKVNISNNGDKIGFRPVLEVILPVNISFVEAEFMNYTIHPDAIYKIPSNGSMTYIYPNSKVKRTVTGQPNATLVLLKPLLNDVQKGMPLPPLTVKVHVGKYARLGIKHIVNVTLIFLYGSDPLDNPSTDPPIVSETAQATIVPQPLILLKNLTTDGWSDKRIPTGPNYWYVMELKVELAPRNFTKLNLTDILPPEVQFVNITELEVISNGTTTNYTLISSPSTNTTGGTIWLYVPKIIGGKNSYIFLKYKVFIPYNYTGDGEVITPSMQDKILTNKAKVTAIYSHRYAETIVNYNVSATVDVLYKDASIYRDNYAPGLSHWDIIKYRVTFYLSDYFNISNLYFRDVLGDGQIVLRNMTPLFWIKNGSQILSGTFNSGEYVYHTDHGYIDNTTLLEFNLTKALLRLANNDTLRGGLVGEEWRFNPSNFSDPFGKGRTWGYIEFYAIVEKEYNGTVPGDRIIDSKDSIKDSVEFIHSVDDYGRTISVSASLTVPPLRLEKHLTHINSIPINGSEPYQISPGDNVTFEIIVTIPAGNTENLTIMDYLPIPVFNVTYNKYGQTPFQDLQTNDSMIPPPPGHWTIAPDDTVSSILGIIPELKVESKANTLSFIYPVNIHYDNITELKIHIYYTFTFTDEPFGDLLDLANLVVVKYQNSFQQTTTITRKKVMVTNEPFLVIEKKVNSTNGYGFITNDSNLKDSDAGDSVIFVINATNIGHSPAYNISISDEIQMPYNTYLENLTGLTIKLCSGSLQKNKYKINISPNNSTPVWLNITFEGPLFPGDCLLIVYNLTINGDVYPYLSLNNTAKIIKYSSLPNGKNFVGKTPPEDYAWIDISEPHLSKTLKETSEKFTPGNYLAIGENATFEFQITLPEGKVDNLTLIDILPKGLTYNGSYTINIANFKGELPTPVFENYSSGDINYVTIKFPGWTNITADNDPSNNVLTIVLTARVRNYFDVNKPLRGTQTKINTVNLDFDSNPREPLSSSYTVYLVEPMPKVTKTFSSSEVDGNDTITVIIKVKNVGLADAFEVYVWDYLDPLFFNLSTVSELSTPSGFTYHYDPVKGLVWYSSQKLPNQSIWYTFEFTVRVREDIVASLSTSNTAYVNFTSLPGSRSYERIREKSYTANIRVSNIHVTKSYYNSTNPYTNNKDLAIGEEVTFKITVKIPEGKAANLTIRDYIPPGFKYLDYQLEKSGLNGELPTEQVQYPTGEGGIVNFTFPGWINITADNNPSNDYFYIYLRLLVLNSTKNQGYPNRQVKTNRVDAIYETGSAPPDSEDAYIVEPHLFVEKTFNVTVADGGDWVKFTIRVSNTGLTSAFDLNLSDIIDGSVFVLDSYTPINVPQGFLYTYNTATGELRFYPAPSKYEYTVLNVSDTFTFEFALKVRADVVGFSTYKNKVYVNATSMPYQTDSERIYVAVGEAMLRIGEMNLYKTLVNSSETFTSGSNLAIGEITWFNLSFSVSEGRILNVTVRDLLPTQGSELLMEYAGKAYITVNKANVASNKVTLTPGDWTEITGVRSGTNLLLFDLGNITNLNDDANPEIITIKFAAIVYNTQGNQRGKTLLNQFYIQYVNSTGHIVQTSSADYTVKVVEPELWSILTATPITVGDSGDVVIFHYNVTNRGDLAYVAPAFDVRIFGDLPPELGNLSVISIISSGAANISDYSTREMLNITLDRLEPGGWINVTFKAVLQPSAVFGQKIETLMLSNGSSLPGRYGHQTLFTCLPGSICGERTGSGIIPNDIVTSDSITIRVGIPNVQKKVLSPSPFAVGDKVPYLIIVGTPKGRTDSLIINDTLFEGLAYINNSLKVRLPANVNVGNMPSNSSPFFVQINLGAKEILVFNFSIFQNNNHRSINTNITFAAMVKDLPIVVRGRKLKNTAILRYKADNGSFVDIGPVTVYIHVGEPELGNLTKTTLTNKFRGGDEVYFKIEFDNNGDTTAYDTLVVDNLPSELIGAYPQVKIKINNRYLTVSDYSTSFYTNGTFKIQFLTPSKYSAARIMPGEHVTITLVATAVSQVPLSLLVTNNASVFSYSSQPDQPTIGRVYSDGWTSSIAETVDPIVFKEVYTSWTSRPNPNDKTRARAVVGEPVSYNITFAMPDGTLAYSVNFSDILPDGFVALKATAHVYNASGFFVQPVTLLNNLGRYIAKVNLGNLVNATVHIFINGKIAYNYSTGKPVMPGAVLINGNDTNKCFFEWSNGKERKEFRTNEAYIEILHSEANLVVNKWFDPPSVFLGGNVTFIVNLKNIGNGTAYNVKVTDLLGESMNYLWANTTPTSVDQQTLTWEIGELDPGEKIIIKVLVQTSNCTNLSNHVFVYWKNPEEPSLVLNTSASSTLDIIPELNVEKYTIDDPTETGKEVRFMILMHNPSCGVAINTNISDILPPHFTYVIGSSLLNGTKVYDPSVNETMLFWNLSIQILPGETYNLTFIGVPHNSSYTSYNVATVYLRDRHNVLLSYKMQSVVHILRPRIYVKKLISPYSGSPNTTFLSKIRISNLGSAPAYFITVIDMLPKCARYIVNTTRINSTTYLDPDISGSTLIWRTNFNLSSGSELTLSFQFNVSCSGTHINNVKIRYFNIIKEYLGEAKDSASLEVIQKPHISPHPPSNETPPAQTHPSPPPKYPEIHITKTANVSRATINDAIDFTLTIVNKGSAPADNLRIDDILPNCLSYIKGTSRVSGKPLEPIITGHNLTWTLHNLYPGDNLTLKFAARILCEPKDEILKNKAIINGKKATTSVLVEPIKIVVNKTVQLLTNKSIAFTVSIYSENYAGTLTVKDYLPPQLQPKTLPANSVEKDGEITWNFTIHKGETKSFTYITTSQTILCGNYKNIVEIVETGDNAEAVISVSCEIMRRGVITAALLFIPIALFGISLRSKTAVYDYKALKKAIKNGYLPLLLQYSDKIVLSSETLKKIYEDPELTAIIHRYNLSNKIMVVPSKNEALITALVSIGLDREPASAIAVALSNNIYRIVLGDPAAYLAAGFVGIPTIFTRSLGEKYEF